MFGSYAHVSRLTSLVLMAVSALVLPSFGGSNDFDVATQALRDGLWTVARTHAAAVAGDEARLVAVESLAREGKWKDILAQLGSWGNPAGGDFSYYRGLALYKTGALADAAAAIANLSFPDAAHMHALARLRASLRLAEDDVRGALKALEPVPDDEPSLAMAAELSSRLGETVAATSYWHRVASASNVTERAFASAAAGLGDVALLREAVARARTPEVRRFASLNLGCALLADEKQYAAGVKLVRDTVRDAPDAPGAREAYARLAVAAYARGDWTAAASAWSDALSIWPDAAKDPSVQAGRGRALWRLGRRTEALETLREAGKLATDDETRASLAVAVGDVLAELGRAEEATEQYRKASQTYPKTVSGMLAAGVVRRRDLEAKARSLYGECRFAEARTLFEQLVKEDSGRADRHAYCRMLCLYGEGNESAAEEAARKLAEAKDPSAERSAATRWLAKLAYNRGRWRESAKRFSDYVASAPKAADAPESLVWCARAQEADHDFAAAIATVARLLEGWPKSPSRAAGQLVQGESLIELGRFDEAVLVLERAALATDVTGPDRLRARMLRADALFAMGADNPTRYEAALEAYQTVRTGETLDASTRLVVAYKVARAFEKLRRLEASVDGYYTDVVLAYRRGREAGVAYDDEARAVFARAGFRLAEELESRGSVSQALHVLELVATSDTSAAGEARRRFDALRQKGSNQ